MASLHEVAPDALPYYDQGYEEPGVREMVSYNSVYIFEPYVKISTVKNYQKFGVGSFFSAYIIESKSRFKL